MDEYRINQKEILDRIKELETVMEAKDERIEDRLFLVEKSIIQFDQFYASHKELKEGFTKLSSGLDNLNSKVGELLVTKNLVSGFIAFSISIGFIVVPLGTFIYDRIAPNTPQPPQVTKTK